MTRADQSDCATGIAETGNMPKRRDLILPVLSTKKVAWMPFKYLPRTTHTLHPNKRKKEN